MKEKVAKSQRTGLVMDCNDFVVLAFLVTVCFGTTSVFALGQELNGRCLTWNDCNKIGYMCAKNKTCQCTKGHYIPNESGTICVGIVDASCKYDIHCIEGAYCTGLDGVQKCKCKEEEHFYPDENGEKCISSAISRHHQGFDALSSNEHF